jgi:hypothetical protein
VVRKQDAAVPNEPGEAAGGERAAAEAEEEELIARLVALDEKGVALADVAREADPERAAAELLPRPRADAALVVHELLRALVVLARDGERELGDVGGRKQTAVQLLRLVPSAVAAHDQALHRLTLTGPKEHRHAAPRNATPRT